MFRSTNFKGYCGKKIVKPVERKIKAKEVIAKYAVSKKKACCLLNIGRTSFYYESKQIDEKAIKEKLSLLAERHPRYGFKKMFKKIRREGIKWNHKRVYRIYCEMELNIRKKPKKRLPSREKVELVKARVPNENWSMDFMSDTLINGKKFRTLNVIDDFNRESLGIKVSQSLPSIRVISILDEIAEMRGYPRKVRVDNGPEYISKTFVKWANRHGIILQYIQPGKPAQNALIERFNRSYREEVLSMYLFESIGDVQRLTDKWLYEYNYERPHEALNGLTPIEFGRQLNDDMSSFNWHNSTNKLF